MFNLNFDKIKTFNFNLGVFSCSVYGVRSSYGSPSTTDVFDANVDEHREQHEPYRAKRFSDRGDDRRGNK